jgi:CRP/FNR family transcriptional regulator, anaerobic regulatory protein
MLCCSDNASNTMAFDSQKVTMLKLLIGASNYVRLDSAEKSTLENANWVIRAVDRGNALLSQGEECKSVSVILSGWSFSCQILADGKRQILDFTLAGTLLGFGANRIAQHGVETITPCVVGSLPATQFYSLLARCPHFAVQIAECIVESEMRAHAHLTHLGRRTARERVAALIIELMSRSKLSRTADCGDGQDLPLTIAMIADALGLSCEHVCRTLAKLADDRVLELKRQSLRVLNAKALSREAGVDDIPSIPAALSRLGQPLSLAA